MPKKNTGYSEPITDINITPLVDVALVMLIIFMIVAPFAIKAGINVLQSKAGAKVGKVAITEAIQVKLDKENKITIGKEVTDFEHFSAMISSALASNAEKMVILTADDENKVGQTVRLLDESKQAGAQKIAIMKNVWQPSAVKAETAGD